MKNRISEVRQFFVIRDRNGVPLYSFHVKYFSGLLRVYTSVLDSHDDYPNLPKSVRYFIDHHEGIEELTYDGRRYVFFR